MYIYKILNTENNKVYIGQTKLSNVNERWKHHLSRLRRSVHGNKHLQSAWNKYKECAFVFSIIDSVSDINLLDTQEIYWITKFGSTNSVYGYNKEGGGNNNKDISKETREKISKSLTGKYSKESHPNFGKLFTEEHKNKLSEKRKLRVITEETKDKISKSQKGKVVSFKTKEKISNTLKFHLVSSETREKISIKNKDYLKNNKHPFLNKKHSEESKIRMSNSAKGRVAWNRKQVMCINNGIIYESALAASKQLNLPSGNVYNVLLGKRKKVKNYEFKYI